MRRRRFLGWSTALGAGLLAPGTARLAWAQTPEAPAAVAPAGADIGVGRGLPGDAVRKALAPLGGIERFVKPDQIVVVKPNASFVAPPEWGATTHPEVLAAVIEACLGAGARRVLVVDHALGQAERCFARSGAAEAVGRFAKAKLVSLDQEQAYTTVDIPRGTGLKRAAIASVALKADVLINLPSAKAHSATRVSLGLKNLMGLVWDRNTFHNDMDVNVGVADLATAVRPHLTILDAIKILKTNGPTGPGEVEEYGGVIAGIDPVAVDAYGVGLSTWDRQTLTPDQVGYIRLAAERGVGTLDLAALRIVEGS